MDRRMQRRLDRGDTITTCDDLEAEMKERGYTSADFDRWRAERERAFAAMSKYKDLPWSERCKRAAEDIAAEDRA